MRQRKQARHLREEPATFHTGPRLREVAASEAKTKFGELLDAAERGETVTITRHGRPVARLVPDEEARRQRVAKALDAIEKLGKKVRKEHGPTTIEEILAWRHEGHKY
jgi:prevent-host-death family protein